MDTQPNRSSLQARQIAGLADAFPAPFAEPTPIPREDNHERAHQPHRFHHHGQLPL